MWNFHFYMYYVIITNVISDVNIYIFVLLYINI